MPAVDANGLRIEYETRGRAGGRPLLLIRGLGTQLIHWDEGLLELLVDRGHRVVIFDNRDVGLSSKLDAAGVPDVASLVSAAGAGRALEVPYTLDDMADDAAGLLDALGLSGANVCGISLGGMVAQTLAVRHPARVCSLISIMSTTGSRELPPARPEAMQALMAPAPRERAAYVEHSLGTLRAIGSPGFPFDEAAARQLAGRAFDRCFCPQGIARQMAAVIAASSRRAALAGVRVPTLVIHGADDPLVPVEGGIETAGAVPGAELLVIEGMGHDLPRGAWPRIVDAVSALTEKAQAT